MRAIRITAALLAATCATAQVIIDKSDAGMTDVQINQMYAVVTADFLDPGSAQFKGLTRSSPGYRPERTICGFVNAKNSFGGYVGFRPFSYDSLNKLSFIYGGTGIAAEATNQVFLSSGCRSALGVTL